MSEADQNGHEMIQGSPCIRCVRCDVVNCRYNDKRNHCTAKDIRVGPQYASCESDTICATFQAN